MAEKLDLGAKGENNKTTSLKYPNNLFEDHTDYVYFKFHRYNGPFSGIATQKETAANGETETKKDTASPYDIYNSTEYEADPDLPAIMLYMPEDISTGYQTDWGSKGFTNMAADVLRGGGSALSGQGGRTLEAVKNMITRAAGAMPTVGAEGLAGAINSMPGGLGGGGVTTNDVLQGTMGVVLNPNTELMFNGYSLRNFSLRFKLAPRSAKEAKDIRYIVNSFKAASLPTIGQRASGALATSDKIYDWFTKDNAATTGTESPAADSNANYIGVPDLCQVQFRKGQNQHPYLPTWKMCAITDVSVNYTPDGVYATYGGSDTDAHGSPVATELTLTFQETKLIYRQDITLNGSSY